MKSTENKIRMDYWEPVDSIQFILALIVIGACMVSILLTVLTIKS